MVLSIVAFQGAPFPAEDDSFARAFIDTLHTGLPREAVRSLSPRLARVSGIEDSLARTARRLPIGAIDSTAFVSAAFVTPPFGDGATWRSVVYDVHTPGGYARVHLLLADELGHHFIDGFAVQRGPNVIAQPAATPSPANGPRSHTGSLVFASFLVVLAIGAMLVLRKPIVTR